MAHKMLSMFDVDPSSQAARTHVPSFAFEITEHPVESKKQSICWYMRWEIHCNIVGASQPATTLLLSIKIDLWKSKRFNFFRGKNAEKKTTQENEKKNWSIWWIEEERGRNQTDKIYIRHCFGFIDINIYIRIWRVLRMFSFFLRFIVWHFVRFDLWRTMNDFVFFWLTRSNQIHTRIPAVGRSQRTAIIEILLRMWAPKSGKQMNRSIDCI